jgi:predicted phage terminase large subunit-like protein
MKLAAEQNIYLPIKKLQTRGMSKESRVRSMSPLIENGIIRIRKEGSRDLRDELTQFPKGAFDDRCDALELAVRVIPSGGSAPIVVPVGNAVRTTAQSIINRVRRW